MLLKVNEKIEKFYHYIAESKKIVFFGGAGVSTESGIPDFRSKDGLYNQHDIQFEQYTPEYLLSRSCLYNNPKVFYEFYRQKLDTRNIKPNITHYWLAELEQQGKLSAIITQNIDGLHQKAGSKTVYEIHGTTQKNYCHRCKKEYDPDYIFNTTESIPKCECGGQIRPDVVLYEENLPVDAWMGSEKAICEADMLIVAGTSLTVYPAANFLNYFMGEHLVIINRDKIDHVSMCDDTDLQINMSLDDVIRQLKEIK